MKKVISLLLVLLLISTSVAALSEQSTFSINLQTATDEELKAAITSISKELENRDYSVDINIVENTSSNFDPSNPPIEIYKMRVEDINSAGGVEVGIYWKNISDEKMKYVVFEVVPYNRVNDIVYSEVGNESNVNLKVTGPIFPYNPPCRYSTYSGDYEDGSLWENVWYNNSVSKLKLVSVTITYMDDTTLVIDGDDANKLLTVKLPK